ncbi:hypothetical protein MXD63_14800 [Frankia sp. Cpl3]|nr:hypothetical protein [Frankia sp. Cpl3]
MSNLPLQLTDPTLDPAPGRSLTVRALHGLAVAIAVPLTVAGVLACGYAGVVVGLAVWG